MDEAGAAADVLSPTRTRVRELVHIPVFFRINRFSTAPGGMLRQERPIADTASEMPAAPAASATHPLRLTHRLVIAKQPRELKGMDSSSSAYDDRSKQRTTRCSNQTFWFLDALIGEDFADSLFPS